MNKLPFARFFPHMFFAGALLLIVPGVMRTYLIMPFPGSQERDSMEFAYFLATILPYALGLGVALVAGQVVKVLRTGRARSRMAMIFFCVFLVGLNFLVNFKVKASAMFKAPVVARFADKSSNKIATDRLVVGVEINGIARAYPINLIAYHHQIEDTLGGQPVWVTYCSLCRTARAFNPIVDGKRLSFKLIGVQRFNSIYEDSETGSWWYQANGTCGAGELKGRTLEEIPIQEMTLSAWLARHPASLVLQPEEDSAPMYASFVGYDTTRQRDTANGTPMRWVIGSWIVGLRDSSDILAIDWLDLRERGAINTVLGAHPIVAALDTAGIAAYVWRRPDSSAVFVLDSAGRGLRDTATNSLWSWDGTCVEGSNVGARLQPVAITVEYWRSWQAFNPKTRQWKP